MGNRGSSLWQQKAPLTVASVVVSLALPLPRAHSAGPAGGRPKHLPIRNAKFVSPSLDEACPEHWIFDERRAEASVSRPLARGGVILKASSEVSRGDLVSSPFELEPFQWVRVTVEYAFESGDPRLLVGLHPDGEPRLVDLEFLPVTEQGQRKSASVRLHSGAHDGDYSIAAGIHGAGAVRVLSISGATEGEYPRPTKPLFILNISTPKPQEEPHPNWARIAWLFGFPSLEMVHFTELTRARLQAIDPALVILPGISQEFLDAGIDGAAMEGITTAVRTSIDYGVPVVGVCFGHQMLAFIHDAGGNRAPESGPVKIKAVKDDPLFDHLPHAPCFHATASHSGMVHLPRNHADLLAISDTCKTQVFRYKGKPWYTFQCHIERNWEDTCPDSILLWKNMLRTWRLAP